MLRRITLAILLTVWAMLIVGGTVAYVAARSVLLAELDDTLVAQAIDRPELLASRWRSESPTALPDGERYVIQSGQDGKKIRAAGVKPGGPEPKLVTATFSTRGDGVRQRTVTVSAYARPTETLDPPTPVTVTYTGSAEAFHRVLDRLALVLAGCVIVGGLVAGLIAHRVSKAALRPLRQTAEVIGSIDERKLDRRIAADGLPPELLPVADRLNAMLAGLEKAFARRRQFLGDASHELRTPVAALVTGLEVSLSRQRPAEAYRRTLEGALTDARHLRRLTERLMEQVRSESFAHDEPVRPVNLSRMLHDCCDIALALGEERKIVVERKFPDGMEVDSQAGRLRSIVQNLVANAVHYNRPGGKILVKAAIIEQHLQLEVTDTGCGIPADQLPHLFEPFYRGDEARHESPEGHLGLGLYLVQTHLRALGGTCKVSSEVGTGTTFCVEVPVQPIQPDGVEVEAASASTSTERPASAA